MGLSYDHSFISFFVGIWENHFGLAIFFYQFTLKLFNFSFILFFPKQIFWFWILKKKIWLDRRKKYILTWHFHSIIIYLPFSQYNHIQNFEEKKLFQHFANLIKIRSNYTPGPRRGRGVMFFYSYTQKSYSFFFWCILYCENCKSEYFLFSWPAKFFFSSQDSE